MTKRFAGVVLILGLTAICAPSAGATFPSPGGTLMYTSVDMWGKALYSRTALEALNWESYRPQPALTCIYDQGASPGNCSVGAGTASPGGDRVGVLVTETAGASDTPYRLVLLPMDGGAASWATLAGPAYEPAWAPDGETLLVTRHDLSRHHGSGGPGRPTLVSTDGQETGTIGQPGASDADWAASGEIAYTYQGQIWSSRVDGEPRQLTTAGGKAPSWSPDSQRIAFERDQRVWVMQRDGTDQRQLMKVRSEEPAWSPDGGFIAFTAWDSNPTVEGLWLMAADGTCPRRVRRGGLFVHYTSPFWRPLARGEDPVEPPTPCAYLRPNLRDAPRLARVDGRRFLYDFRAHPRLTGRAVFRTRSASRVVARSRFTAGARGAVRIRPRLSGIARGALRARGKLRLTARVTVTDRRGSRPVSRTARKRLSVRTVR